MIVKFYDRQNDQNRMNGTIIIESQRLIQIVGSFTKMPPFFCELVGENGFNLLVGVGQKFGCAQFSSQTGKPPCLMATTPESKRNNEHIEFLIGNTPTPVPAKYCLPFELVKQIAVHFQETGNPSAVVQWEEI